MIFSTPPFRPGEKVICLGDSTTHDGYWLYDLAQMIRCRQNVCVDFINAGVSGGNLAGALSRLDWDVIACHPDRVIICFGLNDVFRELYDTLAPDAAKRAERELHLREFSDRLALAFQRLRDAGIPVVVMSSFPFDEYHPFTEAGKELICCNTQGLARLNELARTFSEKESLPFIDIFTPMTQYYRQFSNFQICSDRVHPRQFGYLLAAAAIYDAIYDTEENILSLASGKTPESLHGGKVEAFSFTKRFCRFFWTPDLLPFDRSSYFETANKMVDLSAPLSQMNWAIDGLDAEPYSLKMNGIPCGIIHGTMLKNTMDIAPSAIPLQAQSAHIAALLAEENRQDLGLRRLAQCDLIVSERGGNPTAENDTRKILDDYIHVECAKSQYQSYYAAAIEDYWQKRPFRNLFLENRARVRSALEKIRLEPVFVELERM